jgi:hypothetical protein
MILVVAVFSSAPQQLPAGGRRRRSRNRFLHIPLKDHRGVERGLLISYDLDDTVPQTLITIYRVYHIWFEIT